MSGDGVSESGDWVGTLCVAESLRMYLKDIVIYKKRDDILS